MVQITSVLLPAVAFAAGAMARAMPQDIDFAYVDAQPDPTSVSMVLGAAAQTVTYDATSVVASVSSAVAASGVVTEAAATSTADAAAARKKRTACATQATGAGPVPSPDSASAFLAYSSFASIASAAPTPAGYDNTFTNLQASNNAYGYMGYSTLSSYDTAKCAAKCTAIKGCSAINIYFERDPTVDPGATCENPASTTVIKCVYWGGPVSASNANNYGQWRDEFQVVIAGSNGYVSQSIETPAGYSAPAYLGSSAINAPLDSCGSDTYMGVKLFTSGPFDVKLCAAACSAQTEYNLAHPPSTGSAQTCQFFNTYILYKNSVAQGQYCSMYSETWSSKYATNSGQYSGSDYYSVLYSFSSSNATTPGAAASPCPA